MKSLAFKILTQLEVGLEELRWVKSALVGFCSSGDQASMTILPYKIFPILAQYDRYTNEKICQ